MALWRLPQARSRAESRRPGGLFFIDHQSAQRVQVATYGVSVQGTGVAARVCGDSSRADWRCQVACKGAKYPTDVVRIASNSVGARDISAANLLKIVDSRSEAGLAARSRSPGQPPRQSWTIKSASLEGGDEQPSKWPFRKSARDTSPLEYPVSARLIVRNRKRDILPAPVWRVRSSVGMTEPVRTNRPFSLRSSTARRILFQIVGSICHSSMSRGVSPASTNAGSTAIARRAFSSTSSNTSLAATWRAMAVLPQALGPSMSTAPEDASLAESSESPMLGRYNVWTHPNPVFAMRSASYSQ